jgi:uncharacterized protein YjbI with pentapeptide repeats
MVRRFPPLVGIACLYQSLCVTAFVSPGNGLSRRYSSARTATASNGDSSHHHHHVVANTQSFATAAILSISVLCSSILTPLPALASVASGADAGASIASNSKITTGGASTLQSGRTIAITRGVNLDNSNFAGANLKGVAFQQSIVRDADFSGSNLVGASFFDATVDGSNFEGAGEYYWGLGRVVLHVILFLHFFVHKIDQFSPYYLIDALGCFQKK